MKRQNFNQMNFVMIFFFTSSRWNLHLRIRIFDIEAWKYCAEVLLFLFTNIAQSWWRHSIKRIKCLGIRATEMHSRKRKLKSRISHLNNVCMNYTNGSLLTTRQKIFFCRANCYQRPRFCHSRRKSIFDEELWGSKQVFVLSCYVVEASESRSFYYRIKTNNKICFRDAFDSKFLSER